MKLYCRACKLPLESHPHKGCLWLSAYQPDDPQLPELYERIRAGIGRLRGNDYHPMVEL